MIWGIWYKDAGRSASRNELIAMDADPRTGEVHPEISLSAGFAKKNRYAGESDIFTGSVSAAFQGALTRADELRHSLNIQGPVRPADLIVRAYAEWGEAFIERLDGKFAFFLADPAKRLVLMGRDRFGMETLYVYEDPQKIVFGTKLQHVIRHPGVPRDIDYETMRQFLLYCYNPTHGTFFKNIRKLPPSNVMVFHDGQSEIWPYWKLSFARNSSMDEEESRRELSALLDDSVRSCLDPGRETGVFLSGGMDSSSVTALASRTSSKSVRTFSYRCRGESFDESRYARIVSDFFHTEHHLVEYTPETVGTMEELVRHMDEPFCDVGINLATDILAREAAGKINLVLTGDGGDELFGGHPVYQADRVASIFDGIPSILWSPFCWLGSMLPDSDKKKDWKVKWKRFSRSIRFPAELLSHRWRIYYTPREIQALVRPGLMEPYRMRESCYEMFSLHADTDGRDALSRSIFSDYRTVVGFYLRRMDLVRRFGIEPRFPLLDRRLAEFCANVPSALKIKDGSDVKYIFKKTMQNVLPDEIIFRKDKLGHSIPLKNWMRDNSFVRGWMLDLLSESSLKKRSLFNPRAVEKMIRAHLSKRENHSHRLWALMVLELWMRAHADGK